MNADSKDVTNAPDVRRAYRAEHVMDHLVGCIEQAVRAGRAEAPEAEVLVWHDPNTQRWVATAGLVGHKPEVRAEGGSEIEACRGLLHLLRQAADAHDEGPAPPPRGGGESP